MKKTNMILSMLLCIVMMMSFTPCMADEVLPPENNEVQTVDAQALMSTIAATYAQNPELGEWEIFDMAAYDLLMKSKGAEEYDKISDEAKQNYINIVTGDLSNPDVYITQMTKAEIILSAIGIDSAQLYLPQSETPLNNAEMISSKTFDSDYISAIWTLLANMQGNMTLSEEQTQTLISALEENQNEQGIYASVYDGVEWTDIDSTGCALSALTQFTGGENAFKTRAEAIIEKAVAGLSQTQGENGSYGNANTDAMVIIGLISLGIDPDTDERFVKNGNSLADALLLYVNEDENGFISDYNPANATEQGFRALVALSAFETNEEAYNIYDFAGGEKVPAYAESPEEEEENGGGGGVIAPPSDDDETISITFKIKALRATWLSTQLELQEGETVYHAIRKALEENDMSADGLEEGYIRSITKDGETLAQFDEGRNSGWMYYINGEAPTVGINSYILEDGDKLEFKYISDYTTGGGLYGGGGSSSADEEPKTYTVTFDLGGETKKETVKENETCPKPENPQKDGYIFEGWYTQTDSEYDFSLKITSDISLYAKWTKLWENPFTDVKESDWFWESVKYVCENNIMNGVSKTSFAPNETLTRAMFVTMLYRLENSPQANTSSFEDVKTGEYYENAVNWAVESGIVKGISNTKFSPDESISRQQMAAIIYRYAKYKNQDVSFAGKQNYSDNNLIEEYATDAVCWVTEKGIMQGTGNNVFAPAKKTTRAEAAKVLENLN